MREWGPQRQGGNERRGPRGRGGRVRARHKISDAPGSESAHRNLEDARLVQQVANIESEGPSSAAGRLRA